MNSILPRKQIRSPEGLLIFVLYGVVSVADMYDLCGMTCNYTDNKYGWKSLARADISRVRDGYMIKLPKAEPI